MHASEVKVGDIDRMAQKGKIALTLRAILRYLRHARLPRVDGGRIVIMGNGPSLAENLRDNMDILRKERVLAVNYFATDPHFEEIRPEFYCVMDPALFCAVGTEWAREGQARLMTALRQKTQWPMHLFIPLCPSQFLMEELFSGTPIQLHLINLFPAFTWPLLRNLVYRTGLLLPPIQNVLVAAVFAAINMGFRQVVLIGADHSWPHGVTVGDDNTVCMRHQHFDGSDRLVPLHNRVLPPRRNVRMHEWAEMMRRTFHAYHILADYAAARKVSIQNATPGSLIDAFPRTHLRAACQS